MAAQLHPGPGAHLRLVLVTEQTVNKETTKLQTVKTVDGSIGFSPYISSESGQGQVSLSVHSCYSTVASLVHCKMIMCKRSAIDVVDDDDSAPVTIEAESELYLTTSRTSKDFSNVISLSSSRYMTVILKVTVLFTVYVFDPAPATGPALLLNKARLQGDHCDMKLVVDGVELPAHRAVLAVRSPVLDRMMTSDFREAREGRVEVEDVSRGALEKFLEYLYTNEIQDWGGSELELLQLAVKYMVPELKAECSLKLWSCNGRQALKYLHAAVAQNIRVPWWVKRGEIFSSQLRRRLTGIVVDNMEALANTKEWAEFKEAHPVVVDIMLGHADATTSTSTSYVWDSNYEAFNVI